MIQLKNVSLQVPVSSYRATDLVDFLRIYIFRQKKKIYRKSDWIISDVSFELGAGDKIGIIGRNGAGKSSLLRLIAGMYHPTAGSIEVKGDVLPLLELGAGFQPEFTGRENLHLNGAILGYTKKEIALLEKEIIDFAGIEESIDIPIKYYSSGMGARLAFAMLTSLMPDILILDEVFAAGDKFFHKQALDKINSLVGSANIVIIVSHNIPFVRQTCEKILWLEQGRIYKKGGLELLEEYENLPS